VNVYHGSYTVIEEIGGYQQGRKTSLKCAVGQRFPPSQTVEASGEWRVGKNKTTPHFPLPTFLIPLL